jgi:hypothetical protein
MMDYAKHHIRTARWRAKNPTYAHSYYLANKERITKYTNSYAAIRYALVNDAKNKPCMDCQVEYPPFVMDLDHRPNETKVAGVAQLVNRHASLAKIREEILKCDAVCANCHRLRTWMRKQKQCL